MSGKTPNPASLRLEIGPIIRRAEDIAATVSRDLPGHEGLARAANSVAAAGRSAERVSRSLQRPLGIHRLPAVFLAVALLVFFVWVYRQFFHSARLTIALPDRDASSLRERLEHGGRIEFEAVVISGSREGAARVARGDVDLTFIQGGVPIPPGLPRLETPRPELVLWFLRDNMHGPSRVRRILTSLENEGSHSVARGFTQAWGIDAPDRFVHDWKKLTDEPDYVVPDDVDAVFAVKDPSDDQTLIAAERLVAAGFRLVSPDLGARVSKFDYLSTSEIPRGYLRSDPPIPEEAVQTYSVSTYLVARAGLTPRLLAQAAHLLDAKPDTIAERGFEPTVGDASEMFQGVESFLGIIIYIGLAFLALLGLESFTYRRRFHELNSLISLISLHQSSKDVLGLRDAAVRASNLLYLSLCSDLLGLISMISGYYTQENSSLLYNNLSEVIHQRCDALKINIQLKILHATIDVGPMADTLAAVVTPGGDATPARAPDPRA